MVRATGSSRIITSPPTKIQMMKPLSANPTPLLGQKGKSQEYVVGGDFEEMEINGEKAVVSTSWEGKSFE